MTNVLDYFGPDLPEADMTGWRIRTTRSTSRVNSKIGL